MKYSNGDIYKGRFEEDMRSPVDGSGSYTFEDGFHYQGPF